MEKLIVIDRNNKKVNLFQFVNIIGIANAVSIGTVFFYYGYVEYSIVLTTYYTGLDMLLNGSMWMLFSLLSFALGTVFTMLFLVKNFGDKSEKAWKKGNILILATLFYFLAGVLKLGAPIFYDTGSFEILDNTYGSYIGGIMDLLASAMTLLLYLYTLISIKERGE